MLKLKGNVLEEKDDIDKEEDEQTLIFWTPFEFEKKIKAKETNKQTNSKANMKLSSKINIIGIK